jgi:hypothetical protein
MPSDKDISAIMADGRPVDLALRKAAREALVKHKQAGQPVVVWRDGKTVLIPPEEIDDILKKLDAELGAS